MMKVLIESVIVLISTAYVIFSVVILGILLFMRDPI